MRYGIDVSKYQGDIDWEETKKVIDFAIIRCGYGSNIVSQDDPLFKRNADYCTKLKIPFGTYLYSYALNVSNAKSEAEHTLRLIKNYKLEYPIFLDVEERSQLSLPKEDLIEIVKTYCDIIEKAGYYVGIYASLSTFTGILNSSELDKYDKWVAEWNKDLTYQGKCGMWQYTDNLSLTGVMGRTDGDKSFYDYPKIIRENGLNHLEDDTEEKPVIDLKYKVGDKVYLNGNLYTSEEANIVEDEYKNQEFTISSVNDLEEVKAPYKIEISGFAIEDNLSLEPPKKNGILSRIICLVKKIFKRWK